jgi:hypothetical protein
MAELARRLREAEMPEVLRFSGCTVPTRKGYSWGAAISTDEATISLLCEMWNRRKEIAAALSPHPNQGEV